MQIAAKQAITDVNESGMLPTLLLDFKDVNEDTSLRDVTNLMGIIEPVCSLERKYALIPTVEYDADRSKDTSTSCDSGVYQLIEESPFQ